MTITATAPRASAYRGRLRWWTELPLIAVVYALYSSGRLLVRGDVANAMESGIDILHLEQLMRIDPERWLNGIFTKHAAIGVPADFAYASLHYLVTPAILVWLWRRRPTHYRAARTWLMLSTLIGLIGFTLTPTAPPRLLDASHGFIDTMAQYGSYGWWGQEASAPRGLGGLTNQYAAMPSLHVGWALWCGIMLWRYGRTPLVRSLGILYPLITTFVVMGTANHYLLDAVAGAAVMGIGYLLAPKALHAVDALRARRAVRSGATTSAEGHSPVVAASADVSGTKSRAPAPGASRSTPHDPAPSGVPTPRTASEDEHRTDPSGRSSVGQSRLS
ncbi:phosphatase PAP2 family protein [Streptomyces sp. H39-S7]|uniref:phosphatase PAP2 family protein n=1 Tax=Streptomyces sp. H39-S7 TaxID=3004357 RepID=UPI0022AE88F0|nr:phosphatase PAP2 family protein [Streptomyces sp. H39-S7]MCZ4118910.1 phosphatase PAP2 family protein [Streptomyces sp. H39-S7]